jgi:hypothetical protein
MVLWSAYAGVADHLCLYRTRRKRRWKTNGEKESVGFGVYIFDRYRNYYESVSKRQLIPWAWCRPQSQPSESSFPRQSQWAGLALWWLPRRRSWDPFRCSYEMMMMCMLCWVVDIMTVCCCLALVWELRGFVFVRQSSGANVWYSKENREISAYVSKLLREQHLSFSFEPILSATFTHQLLQGINTPHYTSNQNI